MSDAMHQDRSPRVALTDQPNWPVLVTACTIMCWVALAALLNGGQFSDNVEQFVWAQSVELSYWKHPPLTTWMLAALIQGVGYFNGWTYFLATSCFVGTAFFTWRIALRLVSPQAATLSVLLLGLHMGFSWRAQLFNHNTPLLLFSAMTVWATLRALETERYRRWIFAGVCTGLALLTKYQAVLMISGVALALGLSGEFQRRSARLGFGLAFITALLVFSPHLLGLWMSNSDSLDYALRAMAAQQESVRTERLLGLVATQFKFYAPVLIGIALIAWSHRHRPPHVPQQSGPADAKWARSWFIGLIVWPLCAVVAAALLGGIKLQAQWGLATTQFLMIYMARVILDVMPWISIRKAALAVLAVHILNMGFFVYSMQKPSNRESRFNRTYPAQVLAQKMALDWARASSCPLLFVVGSAFEAGMASMHLQGYPKVLEMGDFHKSPWVRSEEIEASGALHVAADEDAFAPGVRELGSYQIADKNGGAKRKIRWGFAAPRVHCTTLP